MIEAYITLYTMDLVALLFLSGLLHSNNLLEIHRKRSFSFGIFFTMMVILAEVGTIVASMGGPELRGLNIICNVIGFAITPVILIVLSAIFDTRTIKKYLYVLLPTILNFILTILSPFFGYIFYVDANNNYERGSLFLVFVAVYIINIIFLLIRTLYVCNKSLYPIKWKIIGLSLFTISGTCIQLLIPSVYSSWHCVTLSLFLLYVFLSEFDGSFDKLTMLFNRSAFEKALKQLSGRKAFSVIALDINDFKEVNDTYGHEYGDTALKKVATIMMDSFGTNCSSYRIGGDEFCIICMDKNREQIENSLEYVGRNLAKERQLDKCLPTIAYGYSIFLKGETLDLQKMLKQADDQMYKRKELQKKNTL